jgi:hypothetical protein
MVSWVFSVGSAIGNRKTWRVTFVYRVYHLKYNRIWRLTGNVSIFFCAPLPGYTLLNASLTGTHNFVVK